MGIVNYLSGNKEYNYYDSPEGEDCFKKLWFMTKYAAAYGVAASSIDILLYSHPKGYAQTLSRYAYITLPVVGAAAAFASTTCIATNMRQKDDKVNYFLGGYASGAVLGAWQKNFKFGLYGGLALALFGVLKKDSIENDWNILGSDHPQVFGNFWSIKRDFSLLKDPGKSAN